MKKIIIMLVLSYGSLNGVAQNEKYISAMLPNVILLDTTKNVEQLQRLANTFERIMNGEKSEWLPGYYAAYCYINMTYSVKSNMIDLYCDKAEKYLNRADSMSPNNSEITALKAQLASARISVNPMSRGQKYGTVANTLREKAKQLDPTNPRPHYLDGTAYYYTPPMFGCSKEKAKESFTNALKLYDVHKPESTIAPSWGKRKVEYFLKKCEEELKK